MGLDVYLQGEGTDSHMKSETNPEHLFTPVYLRAAYNEGGFNQQMTMHGLPTLWDLFEACGDLASTEVTPNDDQLNLTLAAVDAAIADFDEKWADTLDVIEVSMEPLGEAVPPASREEALAEYRESTIHAEGIWHNAAGLLVNAPLELKAVLVGKGYRGQPSAYVVFDSGADNRTWYREALAICREFVLLALATPGRRIIWSY